MFLPILASTVAVPIFVACSGTEKDTGVASAKLPTGVRKEGVEHEACEESGHRVETLDTNNDGKTDIKMIFDKSTGREICRTVDMNHDGNPDLFRYFEADGVTVRRVEYAFGDDGVVTQIDYYEHGHLARREIDTTGQHRIDTWDFFDVNGPLDAKGRPRPVRRERDTNGDGRVDQWWVWDGHTLTISVDKTGSGRPDPANTIVFDAGDNTTTDAATAAPPPPSASAPPPPPADIPDAGAAATTPSDAGRGGTR